MKRRRRQQLSHHLIHESHLVTQVILKKNVELVQNKKRVFPYEPEMESKTFLEQPEDNNEN